MYACSKLLRCISVNYFVRSSKRAQLTTFLCQDLVLIYNGYSKEVIYISKVFWIKHLELCASIMPPLLSVITLGDATQIGSFLFVSHCPRRLRQVGVVQSWHISAEKVSKNFACVNAALGGNHWKKFRVKVYQHRENLIQKCP